MEDIQVQQGSVDHSIKKSLQPRCPLDACGLIADISYAAAPAYMDIRARLQPDASRESKESTLSRAVARPNFGGPSCTVCKCI
jgi:hypothetical protein